MHPIITKYKDWRFKNTVLLILSIVLLIIFVDDPIVQKFIKSIGSLGYVGSLLSGIFFVSIFTVAAASVVLFDISQSLNPYLVALTAGVGAVVGDYIILRFLKDRVFKELSPLFRTTHDSFLGTIFSSPFFSWIIPLIGALIIASPFPDELGIGLMGLSKIKSWQFILLTFTLNSIGIFIIITLSRAL